MSLYSEKDLNVAAAVRNVLEGKQVQKEEMDPKDHVKEIDGGESFVVVDKDGKAVAKFKDRKEADDYAKENHTDLMAGSGDDEKDEVDESVEHHNQFLEAVKAAAVNEAIDAGDYTVGAEKSKKGYRPKVTHTEKGHTMYLAGVSYKDEKTAVAHAQAYLDAYADRGDRASQRAVHDFQKKNAKNVVEETVEEKMKDKPYEKQIGMGDSRSEKEIRDQISGLSDDTLKKWASKPAGRMGSKIAKLQDKVVAAEMKKRGLEEVAEPEAQGEKDFKDKHVVKKSGAESDGTIVKEDIDEGIMSEIDQMLQDGKTAAEIAKALKLNLKDVTKIIKTFGEAVEIPKEESDKQKKYQAFFKKALAKFGVKSPSELEKDKRAEFFDYVDANYEADNEED